DRVQLMLLVGAAEVRLEAAAGLGRPVARVLLRAEDLRDRRPHRLARRVRRPGDEGRDGREAPDEVAGLRGRLAVRAPRGAEPAPADEPVSHRRPSFEARAAAAREAPRAARPAGELPGHDSPVTVNDDPESDRPAV